MSLSDHDFVISELSENGVATVTLNKPETHNAFDDIIIKNLLSVISDFAANPKVRMLLLKSNGKNFSAGADLNWMKSMASYSFADNIQDAKQLGKLCETLYQFNKPTIAQVQGSTFGGGVGLIACCKIVVAANNSKFCFSEAKLGLIPAVISPYIIKAIGKRNAYAYFATAMLFDSEQAQNMGLCQHIVEANELENYVDTIIRSILSCGPEATQGVASLVEQVSTKLNSPDQYLEYTAEQIAKFRASSEGQEGLQAFLQKRQPTWVIKDK